MAGNFKNLVEMLQYAVKTFGPREFLGTKKDGVWTWTTYADFGKKVDACRAGLADLGIQLGDRVCVISNNREEWAILAHACYGLGASLVPMYEASLPKEWEFIANDCSAVAIFSATDKIHAKAKEIREKVPSVKHCISFALPASDADSFDALLERGKAKAVDAIHPKPEDTSCLIYTSGTTGNPKGVILSHGNIVHNINAVQEMLPIGPEDRSLSFLPWAHSFGHTVELHVMTSKGASVALVEAIDKIVANLAEVQPTMLFAVPRIFNRIYDGVNKQISEKPAFIQGLVKSAIAAAKARRLGQEPSFGQKIAYPIANKLVFGKIRAKFGGRLRYAFSGSAALSKEVAEFIDGLGITVYEGYGLTETAPIATANRPGGHKIGSVGKPIPAVDIVIDKTATGEEKQGEIVIYGPNVMMGYFNRPEENEAVFTTDLVPGKKGFRSGDLGYLDDEGFLYITGRLKELYKLENGKYVAPAPLEENLKLSPFIANAMIYGDNKLYNVAVVCADMANLKPWCEEQGISAPTDDALVEDPRVVAKLMEEVEAHSENFKGYEKVKKIITLAEDFTTENGLLTPSMKLKRRVAMQKFGDRIAKLYEGADKAKTASAA